MEEFIKYIGGGGSLAAILYAIKLGFNVRGIEAKVREDMNAKIERENQQSDAETEDLRRDMEAKLLMLTRDSLERAERLRHEFGETASAIRQKLHDCETWNRDNFVSKGSFEAVINRFEKSIDKLGERIDERLDRIADRIPPKNSRQT